MDIDLFFRDILIFEDSSDGQRKPCQIANGVRLACDYERAASPTSIILSYHIDHQCSVELKEVCRDKHDCKVDLRNREVMTQYPEWPLEGSAFLF